MLNIIRAPHHRLQRKPLVSNPGMHHGTCVTHLPWCTPGSLTGGGGENVPYIPGACTTRNFTYLVRGPWCESSTGFCPLGFKRIASILSGNNQLWILSLYIFSIPLHVATTYFLCHVTLRLIVLLYQLQCRNYLWNCFGWYRPKYYPYSNSECIKTSPNEHTSEFQQIGGMMGSSNLISWQLLWHSIPFNSSSNTFSHAEFDCKPSVMTQSWGLPHISFISSSPVQIGRYFKTNYKSFWSFMHYVSNFHFVPKAPIGYNSLLAEVIAGHCGHWNCDRVHSNIQVHGSLGVDEFIGQITCLEFSSVCSYSDCRVVLK